VGILEMGLSNCLPGLASKHSVPDETPKYWITRCEARVPTLHICNCLLLVSVCTCRFCIKENV
jgi:hypothetical protein